MRESAQGNQAYTRSCLIPSELLLTVKHFNRKSDLSSEMESFRRNQGISVQNCSYVLCVLPGIRDYIKDKNDFLRSLQITVRSKENSREGPINMATAIVFENFTESKCS